MATESSEVSINGELKKLPISDEKKSENRVDAETGKLISDLDGRDDCPVDPVEKIKDGFLNFKFNQFDKYPEFFEELKKDQDPKFLVFACSDSRVSPSHVLSFRLGEAFMFCNIANLVPEFNQLRYSGVGAAIEYSLTGLAVENILIMGHSQCGGIARLMAVPDDSTNDFIDDWVKIALPAKAKVEAEYPHLSEEQRQEICEREAVNLSLVNVQTYPYVRRALAERKLKLWGGYYDFMNGKFELWGFKSEITPPIIIGE